MNNRRGIRWDVFMIGVLKMNDIIFKVAKDNFGFLFILHYYSCSGLMYANR
jgi:hypothetical protein